MARLSDDLQAATFGTTYAAGAPVIRTHRIYQSAADGNVGNDPSAGGTAWIDAGPTNRWAMFDAGATAPTTGASPLAVTITPGPAINTLALLDVTAATVRVQVIVGASQVYDQTLSVVDAAALFYGLPAAAGAQIVITVSGAGNVSVGAAIVGSIIDLGSLEDTPQIGLTDYSKRVTDDFGITSVVERTWTKTLTGRCVFPSTNVDAVQQIVAAVRAVPVLWLGDAAYAALAVYGYFTDFAIDLQLDDVAFCTLTIAGLPGAATPISDADPTATGSPSSLKVVRPQVVTDAALVSINVPENDYPEWSNLPGYEQGARVIRAATHRIYESLADNNTGNDPALATDTAWIDAGPTNRWAMFDQALGSATTANGSIVVTLRAATAVTALAVLDTDAATVRVQAAGYDKTHAPSGGSAPFLDLAVAAGAQITVTIASAAGGSVSAGTLIMGALSPLGTTEISPAAGLTDYSKKVTDDFGNTSVVERA